MEKDYRFPAYFIFLEKQNLLTKRYFTTIHVNIKYLSSFYFPFVTVNVRKSKLARAFFGQRLEKNVRISEKFELSEFELISIKHKSFLRQTEET